MVGLDNWERFYGTYFMYKFGQNILEYIANKYGEDKIFIVNGELLDRR